MFYLYTNCISPPPPFYYYVSKKELSSNIGCDDKLYRVKRYIVWVLEYRHNSVVQNWLSISTWVSNGIRSDIWLQRMDLVCLEWAYVCVRAELNRDHPSKPPNIPFNLLPNTPTERLVRDKRHTQKRWSLEHEEVLRSADVFGCSCNALCAVAGSYTSQWFLLLLINHLFCLNCFDLLHWIITCVRIFYNVSVRISCCIFVHRTWRVFVSRCIDISVKVL